MNQSFVLTENLLLTRSYDTKHYSNCVKIHCYIKGYKRKIILARGTNELLAPIAVWMRSDDETICSAVAVGVQGAEYMSSVRAMESEHIKLTSLEFSMGSSKKVMLHVLVCTSPVDELGATPREDMPGQIAARRPDCDYLFDLDDCLTEIGHQDSEVAELVNTVKKILREQKGNANPNYYPPGLLTGVDVKCFQKFVAEVGWKLSKAWEKIGST